MKVFELGEFGLISAIERVVNESRDARSPAWQKLAIGIGDDTAVWQGENRLELGTTDALVQDVHFTLGTITWRELGWKALAINLSDIAAMGGVPTYALVALALPGDIEVANIEDLYRGMADIGNRFGVAIAGGNIAQSHQVVITLTVLGLAKEGSARVLTRRGAVPGDQIAVTGYPGLSAAGLRMLSDHISFGRATRDLFRRAHAQPEPRIAEGHALVEYGAHAAIDISDGLVGDLAHICEASRVSARVEAGRLPVHRLLKGAFPRGYLDLVLHGGEDYELLFTADAKAVSSIRRALSVPVTVIGEILDRDREPVTVLDSNGAPLPSGQPGWEHFKSVPHSS